MSRVLDVYLRDIPAGKLVQGDAGALSFTYGTGYLEAGKLPLSLSLPLQSEPYPDSVVRAFFSGILPDDIIRHRLARYLGVSEKNPFALLEAIGGECAGALSLFPDGVAPPSEQDGDIEILNDKRLGEILALLKRRPLLAGDDGLRLSLAGAQDKIAVGVEGDKITLVKGAHPTSHILKPLIGDIKDSVQNELFCMCLGSLMGMDVAKAEIRHLGKTPYLLVERYDRVRSTDNPITRLHQEDFCQALGIMPELRYEHEGGPSVSKCQSILQEYSARPAADQLRFLERIIFNYLIGNADAHGKNYSLLYNGAKPELAPAYDLMCTAVYDSLSTRMAMKIGGKYKPEQVILRHWHQLVPDTAAARKNLENQLIKMAEACPGKARALAKSLEDDAIHSDIFGDICQTIEGRAERIKGLF